MKVMTRLQNITYLQTLLEKALTGDPINTRLSQSPSYTSSFLTQCVFQEHLVLFHLSLILTVTARTFLYPVLLHLSIRQRKVTLCVWQHKTVAGQLTHMFVVFRRRWEKAKGPWSEFIRKQLSAGRHNHWRQNPAGKCAPLVFALFSDFTHLTWGLTAAAGATGEGDPARYNPRVLQSLFQRAGLGGPEDAAVWSAVPFTAWLGAANQRKTSALFSWGRKSAFYGFCLNRINKNLLQS